MRVLGEDERRMYLGLREHGGATISEDLVGLGIFLRAKVSQVLDRLEAKRVVVRERHGMTNCVPIVAGTTK